MAVILSVSVCPDLFFEAFLEEQLSYQDAKYPRKVSDLSGWQPDETLLTNFFTPHCCEPAEKPPPNTENEVGIHQKTGEYPACKMFDLPAKKSVSFFQLLQAFYRQQDEIRGLRDKLNEKDVSKDTEGG